LKFRPFIETSQIPLQKVGDLCFDRRPSSCAIIAGSSKAAKGHDNEKKVGDSPALISGEGVGRE
jgi:hypothetical protein